MTRAPALLFVVLPAVAACAESIQPSLGGLRVGASGSAFHVPVMQNERPPFEYPREAWEEGVGGETRLRIRIARDGSVDTAYVVASSGHAVLDSAALAGARELRYRPARRGADPIAVWAVLPVRYPLPARARQEEPQP